MYLTKRERSGVRVLLGLVILVYLLKFSLPTKKIDIQTQPWVELSEAENWEEENISIPSQKVSVNELDSTDWFELGFDSFLAGRIIRFRDRIHGYETSDDLLRVWGMDSGWVKASGSQLIFSTKEERETRMMERPIPFQLDTTTEDQLIAMGLNERFSRNLMKYIAAGGAVDHAEALFKIHGMDSNEVKRIFPFIQFDKESLNRSDHVWDINRMDSAQWCQWKGIGPILSQRIIRYRNSLGGFVDRDQLMEVYGVTAEVINGVNGIILIDTAMVSRFDVNRAGINELSAHPYMNKTLAREIISFRENFRPFNNVKELEHLQLMTGEKLRKIAPYLKVDQQD